MRFLAGAVMDSTRQGGCADKLARRGQITCSKADADDARLADGEVKGMFQDGQEGDCIVG